MDLRKLGALLREERERRSLSLDDVSNKIKISKTCLAAIEEGDEEKLPHPVYAKGFIRNYARLLDMDTEEFRESLAEIYKPEDTPLQHVPLLEDIPEEDGAHASGVVASLRVKRIALVVAILVLVLGGLWLVHALRSGAPDGEQTASTAPAEAPLPAPPVSQPSPASVPASPPVGSTPAAEATPPSPPAAAPAVTPTVPPAQPAAPEAIGQQAAAKPTGEAPSGAEPTPEDRATQDIAMSGPGGQPQTPPAAAAPAPTGKQFTVGDHGSHEVTITANDRCWIQAGADGGTMRDTMLGPGDSFSGRFSDYLLVRLGNAGAVEIHFDGKLYPLHAGRGSVKTLKFLGRKADAAAAQAASETPPPSPEKAVVPEKPAAPTSGEAASGGKELEVFGQDGSWVILTPDAGPSKEVYVKKGQRLTVPFNEKIEVKLGNPSSVVFHYDGKETPVTTERGETKTIRFP